MSLGKVFVTNTGVLKVQDISKDTVIYQTESKNEGKDYFLRMQNDGNLVIYGEGNKSVWSIGFDNDFNTLALSDIPSEVTAPFQSKMGVFLMSPDKKCMANLNWDGKLFTIDH